MEWIVHSLDLVGSTDEYYSRVESIVSIVDTFTISCVPIEFSEILFKTLSKTYKLLEYLTKTHGLFNEELLDMCATLTRDVYAFIPFAEEMHEQEKGGKKKRKVQNSRTIPQLIFYVEQYERFLIQKAKKGSIDWSKFVRRSTVRDFKIDVDDIKEADGKENNTPKRQRK